MVQLAGLLLIKIYRCVPLPTRILLTTSIQMFCSITLLIDAVPLSCYHCLIWLNSVSTFTFTFTTVRTAGGAIRPGQPQLLPTLLLPLHLNHNLQTPGFPDLRHFFRRAQHSFVAACLTTDKHCHRQSTTLIYRRVAFTHLGIATNMIQWTSEKDAIVGPYSIVYITPSTHHLRSSWLASSSTRTSRSARNFGEIPRCMNAAQCAWIHLYSLHSTNSYFDEFH
jgi:hypothetical protein